MTNSNHNSDKIYDQDQLTIAGKIFNSRLLVGTGKYKSLQETALAIEASGAEIVTVAVRRINIEDKNQPMLQDFLNPNKYCYLPNTAGCFTADEAIRTLRLARMAGGWNLVKLEVLAEQRTLYPNVIETVKAAELLIKDGFEVMVYTSDDPIVAKELEDIGCCAIMPLGAPIGSGLGIQNPLNIEFIIEQSKVPILIDAGVGTASDAVIAMEIGCDGVLMNSAIAGAKNPILMAKAMKEAVECGRKAFLAGRMPRKQFATPSSPITGII
jgi:thiazole synthase